MATKDISDLQVLQAYVEMRRQMDDPKNAGRTFERADAILQRMTGQPAKVCWCAMERACGRDLVDYGINLRSGFLTPKGEAFLANSK